MKNLFRIEIGAPASLDIHTFLVSHGIRRLSDTATRKKGSSHAYSSRPGRDHRRHRRRARRSVKHVGHDRELFGPRRAGSVDGKQLGRQAHLHRPERDGHLFGDEHQLQGGPLGRHLHGHRLRRRDQPRELGPRAHPVFGEWGRGSDVDVAVSRCGDTTPCSRPRATRSSIAPTCRR